MVTSAALPEMEDYISEIESIWQSKIMTNMGEKHRELENRLTDYLMVKELSLMSNGHMALELGIQAMNLTGEVITTPFTFASTTHAIVRNNLEPVFCDINYDDYTIDVSKIEKLITDKTTAILPVHVYGNICNVEEIDRIARKYGLKVIYDAAHAFGETYKGRGAGTFGDASIFSFHATKVFNTIEGGAVCFSEEEFGKRLYQLKNFGIKNAESVIGVGANAKMNEFSAAMGLCNLRYIEKNIADRKRVYERYIERLSGIPGLKLPKVSENVTSNYSYFPVLFDEKVYGKTRNEIHDVLSSHGVFTRKYFYPLTSEFECYRGKYSSNTTPVALKVSKRVLTLPLYPELSMEDVDFICDVIKTECSN